MGRDVNPGEELTTAQAHRTAAKHHPRRIAVFGGSFDPIHNGHLAIARAADRRFNFDEIHFIAASRPPHKLKQHLAPFPHRFAMVSLACTEHPHFVPSLAEAGEDFSGTQLHYSVDTVRYFRHTYNGAGDRVFFIIGADAFLDIPMWKEYETLLGLCDFIVANRPGIRAEALRLVIPPDSDCAPGRKKGNRSWPTLSGGGASTPQHRISCWKTCTAIFPQRIFAAARIAVNLFTGLCLPASRNTF